MLVDLLNKTSWRTIKKIIIMNQKLNPIAIVGLFAAIFILLFGTRVTYTVGPGQKAVVFLQIWKRIR